MDAFDDAVRLEQLPPAVPWPADYRAVIPGAAAHVVAEWQVTRDRFDHCILAESGEFHFSIPFWIAHHMTRSDVPLKNACMKIEIRIDPDHS